MAKQPNDESAESTGGDTSVVYRPYPWPGAPPSPDQEISLLQLLNVLLRHRWKILGLPALGLLVAVFLTVSEPSTYTSDASFTPQFGNDGGQLSRLSGVASQFGVNVPTGDAGQSPQFYADLLTSRPILQDAAQTEYSIVQQGDTVPGNLLDYLGISRLPGAVGWLKQRVSARTKPETGVIEVSVTTESPTLSKQIAARLLELVNHFNLEVRQSQASARADFVEERMEHARRELRAAEDSLERFLDRNRSFQNSPTLRFEHERLQRRVDLKQQVYSSLATRHEQAQIAEVQNTPVITIVIPPALPAGPDAANLLSRIAVGLALGGILGLLWTIGAEFIQIARREEEEAFREFLSLKADATGEIQRTERRVRRLLGFGDN